MKRTGALWTAFMLFTSLVGYSQQIHQFTSPAPSGSVQAFRIPPDHIFQNLMQVDDPLTTPGDSAGQNPDFTGYIPRNNSSELGYLGVNHEHLPGGVTILDISYSPTTQLWEVSRSRSVDFSDLAGPGVAGTRNNCSGGITPWGTLISCEENESLLDSNGDGYEDWGWNIEIDPASATVLDHDQDSIPDKLWAMGRMKHENVVVAADERTAYFGEDKAGTGFLYKFVSTTPRNLYEGDLYVLQTIGRGGDWIQVPNLTQQERNRTVAISDSLGGTKFDRIEDVEIGPDGKIYFASTTQNRVFRFDDTPAGVINFEVFVEHDTFDIAYPGGTYAREFTWPDNMAFDCAGNLWVMQDGGGHYIWVIGPGHSATTPDVRIYGKSPAGSEPTGITFSPDCRFMFMSVQHPFGSHTLATLDAAGDSTVFNRGTTLVLGHRDVLGRTVSVEEGVAASTFTLFPNPVEESLSCEITGRAGGEAAVTITDMRGRIVLEKTVYLTEGHARFSLKLPALPAGAYLFTLAHKQFRAQQKFIRK